MSYFIIIYDFPVKFPCHVFVFIMYLHSVLSVGITTIAYGCFNIHNYHKAKIIEYRNILFNVVVAFSYHKQRTEIISPARQYSAVHTIIYR